MVGLLHAMAFMMLTSVWTRGTQPFCYCRPHYVRFDELRPPVSSRYFVLLLLCFHAWPSFCSGCKRTPKSFDLLKIWATPLKIWVKSPKIRAKNGAQRCLTSENNTQRLQKNTIKTFSWRSHQKQVFMLFVGENVGNRRTKAIWASLGKFR